MSVHVAALQRLQLAVSRPFPRPASARLPAPPDADALAGAEARTAGARGLGELHPSRTWQVVRAALVHGSQHGLRHPSGVDGLRALSHTRGRVSAKRPGSSAWATV